MERHEAVVLGAGFAGLGTAAMLQRRGIETHVVERSSRVGESWRHRYDSLRLNTLRWMSTLSGYRLPRRYGRWPTRDQLIEYLEDYAREMRLRITFEVEAERIERVDGAWIVRTSAGELEAPAVVVATGYDLEPKLPDWPGRDGFAGELIHASAYRSPEPFRGKDVLVVSAGNTGSEVACELATSGAERVRTAMRSSPNIVTRQVYGVPAPLLAWALIDPMPTPVADRMARLFQRVVHGDLSRFGIPRPTYGLKTNVLERHVAPVVDAGFVSLVKEGVIEILAAVEAFDGADVVLADGTRVQPEVVIAATGYSRGLAKLVGHLGALDATGQPTHNGVPGNPETPGLYFNGYRTRIAGQLGLMRTEARRIAGAVAGGVRG